MRENPDKKSIWDRIACQLPGTVTAVLWFVVFPLWQGGSYTHITADKWKCMLVLTLISIILTIGSVLAGKFSASKKGAFTLCKLSLPQILAMLFFLWVCLSAVFGAYHEQLNGEGQKAVLFGARRFEGLVTQLCYCAVFFCLSIQETSIRKVSNAAAVGILIYFSVVLLQYAGNNPFGLFPNGLSVKTYSSFQGTIGNIDVVSGYIVLIVGLVWGRFVAAERGGWLCWIGGLSGVLLALFLNVQSGIIALTGGSIILIVWMMTDEKIRFRGWLSLTGAALCLLIRTCLALPWETESGKTVLAVPESSVLLLLSMLFMMCAMTAFRFYHPGKAVRWERALLILFALVIILLVLFSNMPLKQQYGGLWELQQTLKGQPEDYFGSWRIGVWRITLGLIKQHPLFGTGPDTFYYSFNPVWKEYEAYLRTEKGFTSNLQTFDTPHNEYLAIASNNGIPALFLYLCLIGTSLYVGIIKGNRNKEAYGFVIAVFFYLVQGFFSFSICLVAPLFWATLGIMVKRE